MSVWRGLSEDALADYEALAATAFFPAAIERGDVVATEPADPDQVGDAVAGRPWAGALRHERIEVLSYPYEWGVRDAAGRRPAPTLPARGPRSRSA